MYVFGLASNYVSYRLFSFNGAELWGRGCAEIVATRLVLSILERRILGWIPGREIRRC